MTNERIFIELKKAISETLEPSKVKVELSKTNVTPKTRNMPPPTLRRSVALNNLL